MTKNSTIFVIRLQEEGENLNIEEISDGARLENIMSEKSQRNDI
jgi:hypothetical protein